MRGENAQKIVQLPFSRATWARLALRASDLTMNLQANSMERRRLEDEAQADMRELQGVWQAMHGWSQADVGRDGTPKAA